MLSSLLLKNLAAGGRRLLRHQHHHHHRSSSCLATVATRVPLLPERQRQRRENGGGGGGGDSRKFRGVLGLASAASVAVTTALSDPATDATAEAGGEDARRLPTVTMAEVARHNSMQTGVWVVYQDVVYDVTEFVAQHPGGEKILLGAGKDIEPFWDLYAVHKTAHVLDILAQYRVANLAEADAAELRRQKAEAAAASVGTGAFANEPARSQFLIPVSRQPFNAMSPPELLTDRFYTPNAIHFVRNHLPVPQMPSSADKHTVALDCDRPGGGGGVGGSVTVAELRAGYPRVDRDVTIACAGNRRSEMAQWRETRGLAWRHTAVSNARWTGAPLAAVLRDRFGLTLESARRLGVRHVQFEGMDADRVTGDFYGASVPVEVALDESRGLLLAYEMNGEPIPTDHGFPVRLIVPGAIGARSVKWLNRIVLSGEESRSFWQRRDYKLFPHSVVSPGPEDFDRAPAQLFSPVVSAVCWPPDGYAVHATADAADADTDTSEFVELPVRGYAFSGGGCGVARVEVTIDDGSTWQLAEWCHPPDLPEHEAGDGDEAGDQPPGPVGQRWAWRLWEATVRLPSGGGSFTVACKAVDDNGNQQPERWSSVWNPRGLLGNAWHRVTVHVHSHVHSQDG